MVVDELPLGLASTPSKGLWLPTEGGKYGRHAIIRAE